MNCNRARGLFGACWDDELTQGEREWLEAHFAACPRCRTEYDELSRALEWTGALPRVEAAPDLADRVLARARRLTPAPDRVGARGLQWVPAVGAAAAALVVIAGLLVASWVGWGPGPAGIPSRVAFRARSSPAPVATPVLTGAARPGAPGAGPRAASRPSAAPGQVAVIADSLFDHSEDVEFILDPVTLHRGRASVSRSATRRADVRGEQALITF